MTSQLAPITLADLQQPVRTRLERVPEELRRIVEADFGLIAQVNSHLFQMQGKMFRPTLLLLADEATGCRDPRTITLAAVVELIHVATLVHESRHSDGHGSNIGFFHEICLSGDYAGRPACDKYSNGAYKMDTLVIKSYLRSCGDCSFAQRETLRLIYLDSESRLLPGAYEVDATPEGRR